MATSKQISTPKFLEKHALKKLECWLFSITSNFHITITFGSYILSVFASKSQSPIQGITANEASSRTKGLNEGRESVVTESCLSMQTQKKERIWALGSTYTHRNTHRVVSGQGVLSAFSFDTYCTKNPLSHTPLNTGTLHTHGAYTLTHTGVPRVSIHD